jgi:hypothetical protein
MEVFDQVGTKLKLVLKYAVYLTAIVKCLEFAVSTLEDVRNSQNSEKTDNNAVE